MIPWGLVDLSQFKDAMTTARGNSVAGTWHILDGAETGWSPKPSRPWLLVSDHDPGPTVQMIPRSTQDRGQPGSISHGPHAHPEYDSDSMSCRINEAGVVCVSGRKGIRRALIADNRAYSCLEPDDEILEAVGCRR